MGISACEVLIFFLGIDVGLGNLILVVHWNLKVEWGNKCVGVDRVSKRRPPRIFRRTIH